VRPRWRDENDSASEMSLQPRMLKVIGLRRKAFSLAMDRSSDDQIRAAVKDEWSGSKPSDAILIADWHEVPWKVHVSVPTSPVLALRSAINFRYRPTDNSRWKMENGKWKKNKWTYV